MALAGGRLKIAVHKCDSDESSVCLCTRTRQSRGLHIIRLLPLSLHSQHGRRSLPPLCVRGPVGQVTVSLSCVSPLESIHLCGPA